MDQIKFINLGEFDVESNEVIVCDPCYEPDIVDNEIKIDPYEHYKINVENGKWIGYIGNIHFGGWGKRNCCLLAVNANYINGQDISLIYRHLIESNHVTELGVDSGQMCVIDKKYFYNDPEYKNVTGNKFFKGEGAFYNVCSFNTLKTTNMANVVPHGVVSSSGLGDGFYKVFIIKENDKATAIAIEFITINEILQK